MNSVPARPYPARARVGLLLPSTNWVMEPDLWDALWPRASVHTSRLPLDDVTADAERRMVATAPMAAAAIGPLRPDVTVFGCTSAGGVLGRVTERQMVVELAAHAQSPVVSVIGASLEVLRSLGVRRLAIFTPYVEDLTDAVAQSFSAEGFAVEQVASLGLTENQAIGLLTPDEVAAAVIEAMEGTAADAVFVSCTNLRAVAAREWIEAALGRPVVTSNSAVADVVNARLDALEREPV